MPAEHAAQSLGRLLLEKSCNALWEIQEAAKLITESVDPNAKIIFGTVRDERLKKNELRITVIAANFPNSEAIKKSLFDNNTNDAPVEKERGKIFNSIPVTSFDQPVANSTEPIKIDKKKDDKEDDDWNAIPAFLRRSKLK